MSWTNQTFKQLAERAAWRAHLKPRKKKKRISLQARKRVGPPIKESGSKQPKLTVHKL